MIHRFRSYEERFGSDSWELDALDPLVLRQLVVDTVMSLRDEEIYNEELALRDNRRTSLNQMARDYAAAHPEELEEESRH